MLGKVNPRPHGDQHLGSGSSPSQEFQGGTRELTDDEKIDLTAAKILETCREAFLELSK
ncbi:hypothetical protein [Pseudoflavonifractor sp. AF19-9AC]|uniref:hypothetical protein n=1 Tax=Pseudoflavonifractor sp. AF19-9AC TaxID=2292244 RepID=UPI0013144175|nr:hypothetical protein [Pseudoflavonifractor sp. AF19-9AC]